ncbi:MAG TPA: P1 family peptidase [Candidatus Pullichristensenella stercorigallinarum]|uniref:P1 family peptidase n=1 Tax=Candidatus Pullichristensenella stercorigallinarum TaxID=2840909 RepID=A0A9D0ZP02_9FIRM|nr:P1 family peptidase [Candidatus Pullichristensenella stercorigallinarum]
MKQKRIRDYGIKIGEYPTGPLNKISDVPGVLVGHATLDDERHKTGLSIILPGPENPFLSKPVAAAYVLNGFGKSLGLMQIQELGVLETPIALTNTLNVGLVHDALVGYMIEQCQRDGIRLTSVNPVVCECNDATLNDIQKRDLGSAQLMAAIQDAQADFAEGDVGCGKGMVCHSLKGGVGSASRQVEIDGHTYTIGVLVQSNHGSLKDLIIAGKPAGRIIDAALNCSAPDKGSIISVMATDIPLSSRQIGRVIRRASVGLARLGSFIGHGSGEVMLGFTTANRVPHAPEKGVMDFRAVSENRIDSLFRAMAEAEEEAVLNSMVTARTVTGYDGTVKRSLNEFMDAILAWRE